MADSIFSCVDEDAQELEAQQSGDDGYLASPVSLSLDGSEDGGGAGVPLEAEALEALADAAPEPDVPGPDRAARSLPGISRIAPSLRRYLDGLPKVAKVAKGVKEHLLFAPWRPTWERRSFMVSRGSRPFVKRRCRHTGTLSRPITSFWPLP